MERVKTRRDKFLVILVVFMMMFSNFGYTLQAIATSDEFEVISNGFFKKDEIKFNAYFEDENGNQVTEITGNVNQKAKLIIEVLPQVEGYLKSGTIRAVSSDGGDANFIFSSVTENLLDSSGTVNEESTSSAEETLEDVLVQDETSVEENESITFEENEVTIEDVLVESTTSSEDETAESVNEVLEDEVEETENANETSVEDIMVDTVTNPLSAASTALGTTANSVTENIANEETNEVATYVSSEETENILTEDVVSSNPLASATTANVEDEMIAETVSEENASIDASEDELVDEEAIIEEETEKSKLDEEIQNAILDVKLVSENEIELSNIIKDTKIEVELEFVQEETLNIEDLYKDIKLQLSGTYINSDLEEVAIGKEEEITVIWEYTKDITLNSEYTKISPFELEDIQGTIVENKITVSREIEEEKYLPVQSTRIEIDVPQLNGNNPIEVDVKAEKLLMTTEEDIGLTTFSTENWSYDQESGKIVILVENDGNIFTEGTDEYVVTYRYTDYTEGDTSNLLNKVKATVTEYSGKENNVIEKEVDNSQDIKVDVGELVTYSISSNSDKINKAKIYANYNSDVALYETYFTSQVNVNILTSDVLQQLKIDCLEEYYKDSNGVMIDASSDVTYKQIKFNYSEISDLLSEGGEIVITNSAGETLYILNKDVITNEEDCSVSLNGQSGIVIYVNNISKNGNLNFELTKAIAKSNYAKSIFKSVAQIESRITAEVKYVNIEERLTLDSVSTTRDFEESKTVATLSVNRDTLSTIKSNANVELKIELNNDEETSDLYVNPSFEIVFPKYVTSVGIESMNILNDCGLRIGDFETYTESDIVKMRIELVGTQTTFSENTMTNGTNIIINVNIEVDDYAPAKEDQIKMYYCNEGVVTYESQTTWTISKQIPNGILKTTNGFDVEVIKYQAPTGLIAINGLVNYDGNLSEVRSVKQGTVTEEIPVGSSSRIVTMELLALNNTDNTCSDVVLLGRVPFKGNTDVITGEDLGTTVDCTMIEGITEDVQNGNTVTIYYSSNATATKDLDNISNGWTTEVENLSEVKSYMIVVKGNVEAGASLRFTYDFQIPENLPYESSITGSFGSFYNNRSDVAVTYESSSADSVVLATETGPQLEAVMSVNVGDGTQVLSNSIMVYTITVTNTGSVTATDVKVNATIPGYTNYVIVDANPSHGNYGYVVQPNEDLEFSIEYLRANESTSFYYIVQTGNKPTLAEYATGEDENGFYKIIYTYESVENEYGETEELTNTEKEYITEIPSVYITNKATVTSSLSTEEIETNEVSNELIQANFSSQIGLDYDRPMLAGYETNFTLTLKNTSGEELNNVVATFNVGDIYSYNEGTISSDEGYIEYKEEEGKVYYYIGSMYPNESITLTSQLFANDIEEASKTVNCYFEFTADGIEPEYSLIVPQTINRALLTAEDISIMIPETINENDSVVISTQINNVGETTFKNGTFSFNTSDAVKVVSISDSTGDYLASTTDGNIITATLPYISEGESLTIDITLKAKNLSGTESSEVSVTRVVSAENQDDISLDAVSFTILNSEKTEEEIEEERINTLNAEYEAQNTQEDESESSTTETSTTQTLSSATSSSESTSTVTTTTEDSNSSSTSSTEDGASNSQTTTTYSISGLTWVDENEDGIRDDEEELLSGVKVYLMTLDSTMLKSTVTGSNGNYQFNNVENGEYIVAVKYDEDNYEVTTYKKTGTEETRNNDFIETESEDISAITENVIVSNSNLESIDLGLQNKDTFDLVVNKYLSKVTVETSNDEDTYEFDNLEIAKVEIPSKKLNGAKVTLEYNIIIENVGSISGYAQEVADYVTEDLEFDENENSDWVLGNDGYIYATNISQTLLEEGEKIELKLKLTKTMNESNTGTITNKVALLSAYNTNSDKEISSNNIGVQNTLILVSTGYTLQITIGTIVCLLIIFIIVNRQTNLIVNLSKKKYKTDVKKKHDAKKKYR